MRNLKINLTSRTLKELVLPQSNVKQIPTQPDWNKLKNIIGYIG